MYIKIKVIPSSKVEKVEKKSEDSWYIWTTLPAKNGLANNRVVEIVREAYPHQPVRIISGHQSPGKIVSIG